VTGDALAGRFFRHRLLPFSLVELSHLNETFDFNKFLDPGGFPEPFLSDNRADADSWN